MKQLITDYGFDASAQTVTFSKLTTVVLERVLLITNVTDNVIIYNFSDATKGGTVATNVLTLTYDTTSMADADDLQIWYDSDNDYVYSNKYTDATYTYYGFQASDGSWYIRRKTLATDTHLFASGDSAYSTAWSGLAGLTYQSWHNNF